MSTENKHRQFKEGIPNPGSREAVNQGCICPVWDNEHGEGMNIGDRTLWYVTKGCPLHSQYINWESDEDSTNN